MPDDIFRGLGVEIALRDDQAFLIIVETLTRMGVASKRDRTLFQSAHILHKRGRYAIMHFKELFILDGRESDLVQEDIDRRNVIVRRLEEWGLLRALAKVPECEHVPVRILSHREKTSWKLVPKYSVGRKR